jgi:hypothetical protein
VEEPTYDADANQQQELAQEPDEAADNEKRKADEDHRFHEGKVENVNERLKIVGNNSPSSDKDLLNRHGRQFEEDVSDAVKEADSVRIIPFRW